MAQVSGDDTGAIIEAPLSLQLLKAAGGSMSHLSFVASAANQKAARRTGDPSNMFEARVELPGTDHGKHELLAKSPRSPGSEPLVTVDHPVSLGHFQVIRPTGGVVQPGGGVTATNNSVVMGVDLGAVRVRFTPGRGEVYGPPEATAAPAPVSNRIHEIVKPENRILNPKASWMRYNADYSIYNNPEPFDTYDGADVVDNALNQAWGVVDDTCDGVIQAALVLFGRRFTATARVFVGPPDFAPDRRPFLTLADDLADRDLGVPDPVTTAELDLAENEVNDLFQRVFETASLINLDAIRLRAVQENAGNNVPELSPPLPHTDSRSMTAHDKPYAELSASTDLTAGAITPTPYADLVPLAHAQLGDLDTMVEFLRTFGQRVRKLLRPPYGAFKDLAERPGVTPASEHRDPRVARDATHDMRMPPYMRDCDATALSLLRRQYLEVLALVDYLAANAPKAATLARSMTDGHEIGKLVRLPEQPGTVVESPIRRRVREFMETHGQPATGAPRSTGARGALPAKKITRGALPAKKKRKKQ